MSDRKMAKWQAFDSIMDSKAIVNELSLEKEKISRPIISNDQVNEINEVIIYACINKLQVTTTYFNNESLCKFTDYIEYIDTIKKRITFKNHSFLYFKDVINVCML